MTPEARSLYAWLAEWLESTTQTSLRAFWPNTRM